MNQTTLIKVATHFYPIAIVQAGYFAQTVELPKRIGVKVRDTITRFNGQKMQMFRVSTDLDILRGPIIANVSSPKFAPDFKAYQKAGQTLIQNINNPAVSAQSFMDEFTRFYAWCVPASYAVQVYAGVLPPDQADEILRICAQYRTVKDAVFVQIEAYIKTKAKALNIEPHLLSLEVLTGQSTYDPKIEQGFVCSQGKIHYTSWEDFLKNSNYTYPEEEKIVLNQKIITGTAAFYGVAQGPVKLVFNNNDLNKVEPGDILVTPMTMVSFTPALVKAAAIVTDDGGIMCHAAVVARELQKPCLIATKIATRLLRDGEIVILDTQAGTVTRNDI